MREIQLHGKIAAGRVTRIDDGDFDLVNSHRWNCHEEAREHNRTHGPYAKTKIVTLADDGTPKVAWIFMHVMIMGFVGVDHADHDGLNNQRSNLRAADTAQNNYNQRPRIGTASRYKGVTWHKKVRKWQATIKLGGRCVYLGVYTSEEDAARAYDVAALEAYGERAYLNGVAA